MFYKRVKHYHQWLRTAIPFKAKFGQIPSDPVRVQGPAKRPSPGHLYPVSPVKERNRKGGKCKISLVLQSPVPSTQASPKVEASHRPKQAQHFSTRRKVQNGNSRVHQDLPDSKDNSKNKASLWRWQRELLLLSGHQQGPSTSQSGPYLQNGAEKIWWISPLHL